MLSDRDLGVTDAFGLRNQGAHSGPVGEDQAEALPVPTTLLVSADGVVLWMDQSENYQNRSGPEVVLAAMQQYLDVGESALIGSSCLLPWLSTTTHANYFPTDPGCRI